MGSRMSNGLALRPLMRPENEVPPSETGIQIRLYTKNRHAAIVILSAAKDLPACSVSG